MPRCLVVLVLASLALAENTDPASDLGLLGLDPEYPDYDDTEARPERGVHHPAPLHHLPYTGNCESIFSCLKQKLESILN